MSDETLDDLRLCVSNCFNAKHVTYSMSGGVQSGYNHLSKLMIDEYDLTHNDVDNVVGDIEELVAQYIMELSPKFTDNDE
tara:strand:- start:310 stop:549 length:240 start_codon:yes stop_codon:yes gene_type:complete